VPACRKKERRRSASAVNTNALVAMPVSELL